MSDTLEKFVDGLFNELHSPQPQDAGLDSPTEPMLLQPAYAEKKGDPIGFYTLIGVLGEGGFGSVWRAEQAKPMRREVALKIIKPGMDTREVITRFEAERQALAVLDHPNVAKVFDAGVTPTGRPYFVMELVNGSPLTSYCHAHQMTLAERLALFVEICRAVQHAHQKGIIHRDLKPSNLLVTLVNGKPVPKVIDFGIAKATGESRLTENTLVTRMDRLMGTPAYMSPEQAEPGLDIDTRTDIYSLGVVLYELLTGQVPFQTTADGKLSRDREAQRPSTRLKSLTAEQLQQLGVAQQVDGPRLIGLIKGDLDWIVMKALERDRTRRYDSANAFADDVLAFLHQQPVHARPPTTWYLISRFTQRNKLAVAAAAVIVLLLIAGITTSTLLFWRARTALDKSEQVSAFLKRVLQQAGPSKALGRDTTMVREILLHGILAQTYESIDEYDLAFEQAKRQLELVRAHHRGDDPVLAEALLTYGSTLESLGRSKEAVVELRHALEMRQRLYGEDDIRTGEVHLLVAFSLVKSGRAAEGESSARAAMALWRKHSGDSRLAGAPNALGAVLFNTKRSSAAVEVMMENLALLRRLYPKPHPDLVFGLDNLGHNLVTDQRFEEAEPYLLESLEMGKVIYKDRNPVADHAYASLARIAAHRKQWDKQLEYARQSYEAAQRVFTPGHRYYREGSAVLARVLIEQLERCIETDPARAQQLLAELTSNPDCAPEVKSAGGWVDCLHGRVLRTDPAQLAQANELIARGLAALKQIPKPTALQTQRI
jgi:eukaryotic-like serine/threonine-protein kinase